MQYFCAYILLTIMTSVSKIQNVHLLTDFEIITKSPKSNTICMSLSISYVGILFSINTRIDSTQNEILTIMHVKLTFFFFNHTGETELLSVYIVWKWYIQKVCPHAYAHSSAFDASAEKSFRVCFLNNSTCMSYLSILICINENYDNSPSPF